MLKNHFLRSGLLAMLMVLLSGCFMREPNELCALPKQAEDYFNLQQAIDEVMVDAVYSAPISGENRQPVQLKDLDGDGSNEAILFAKTEGEHPLKIYVFHREDSLFSQIACLEGDGVNFDTVQFVQIDAVEGLEMVVSRQLNDSVPQTLCVYTMQNNTVSELLNINVFRFVVTDLDQDEVEDVFALHSDAAQHEAIADLYSWKNGQMYADSQPLMGTAVENVIGLQAGKIENGLPAIFVTGSLDENLQTAAVLIIKDHKLLNLFGTDRKINVPMGWNVMDVDFDGAMEIPELLTFADKKEVEGFALVRWLGIQTDGTTKAKTVNLHNMHEQWYFNVPQTWQSKLCVETESGENSRKVLLVQRSGENVKNLVTISAESGIEIEEQTMDKVVVLGSRGNVTYTAETTELTPDAVSARFVLLQDSSAVNKGDIK